MLFTALLFRSSESAAADFGVHGPVFDIVETDMTEWIKNRFRELEASGKMAEVNEQMKQRTIGYVNRPRPVAGVTHTETVRSWMFDPSIVLQNDLKDDHGQVLKRAGTRVNPLEYRPLTNVLIFVDADDEKEWAWALKTDKERAGHTTIILVRGPVMDLMKSTKRKLYFDQDGRLTGRFGIKHVPAIVRQEGDYLRIDEVLL